MTPQETHNWNASAFFEDLTDRNRLARNENFVFCRVSGLEGFEEALHALQTATAIVAVSDTSQGYMEMNNTPRTRRVKTVFLAMRHALDDMAARQECFDTLRELFRQFMSVLLMEKTRLEQHRIYLDSQISFTEIERYFFSGAACAYFQIAVDTFTDLRFNVGEWYCKMDLWLMDYGFDKIKVIKVVKNIFNIGLKEAKEFVESLPQILFTNVEAEDVADIIARFDEYGATTKLKIHDS